MFTDTKIKGKPALLQVLIPEPLHYNINNNEHGRSTKSAFRCDVIVATVH